MTEKKEPITLDELSEIVAERNAKEKALKTGEDGEDLSLDQTRVNRMKKLREKYPEGLHAIVHPTRNARNKDLLK